MRGFSNVRRACIIALLTCIAALGMPAAGALAGCTPVPPVQQCPTPKPKGQPAKSSGQPDTVDMERQFFDLVNAERARRGMRSLAYNGNLTDVARRHSNNMASSGRLYHNTSELQSSDFDRRMGHPTMVGENVGDGPSVEWLHDAFMNSTEHRSNILESRYTAIGVGVAFKDNTVWVTQDYIRGGNASTKSTFPYRQARVAAPKPPAQARYRAIIPAKPLEAALATATATARAALAASRTRPAAISVLRLPPVPAPAPGQDAPLRRSRPLLPLAVLATLSAVAFASRRDAGAYI